MSPKYTEVNLIQFSVRIEVLEVYVFRWPCGPSVPLGDNTKVKFKSVFNCTKVFNIFWRSKFRWVALHQSSTLVCQVLLLATTNQVLWFASVCYWPPPIKYFGLPVFLLLATTNQVLWFASFCYWPPPIKYFGLPVFLLLATTNQVLWFASFCYWPPPIKYFGLPVFLLLATTNQVLWSASVSVTGHHQSSTLVCQCFCYWQPPIKYLGLPVSVTGHHQSSTLVCHFLLLATTNHVLWFASVSVTGHHQSRTLVCQCLSASVCYWPPPVKYFGLPVFLLLGQFIETTTPKSLPFGIGFESIYITSVCSEWHAHEPKGREGYHFCVFGMTYTWTKG